MSTTFPQTEINLEALENVRTRLFQLQESILFFLRSINPETTPGTVSWTELHSKFNVLIAKYLHLTNILNDPHSTLLQSYIVFPNESPANDQQVQNLSVLLRTKLFPELQQDVEDRTRDGDVPGLTTPSTTTTTGPGAGGGANASAPIGGTPEERRVLAALKLKVTMHDALCQAADEIFENQRDMVHTKVRYESDDEDEVDNNADAKQQQVDENNNTPAAGTRIGKTDGNHRHMANDILQVDDFAIGASSSLSNGSVRYIDDWGGVLNDVGGFGSMEENVNEDTDGDGQEELDDKYFEMRRQEAAAAEQEESEEESSGNEIEEDNVMTPVFQADVPQSVEEQGKIDEHDDDDFMEVSTQSQAMETAGSNTAETMMEDTFGGESGSGEEDMEEIM
ncbi:hypothetical protein BG011_002060 [Mortierella polycephala]|uniref:Mediator of RNA polymerase II transcription subunit 8 n=1 Tax=Mortierella polycephala TaxID=41804 RepID=A0A9P6Q444_9FUNG|nr:hypothetical protein BG011_002060 [Mortierella polycephala]